MTLEGIPLEKNETAPPPIEILGGFAISAL